MTRNIDNSHVPDGYRFTAQGDDHEIVYTIKRGEDGKIVIHWEEHGVADFLDDCEWFVHQYYGTDNWCTVE